MGTKRYVPRATQVVAVRPQDPTLGAPPLAVPRKIVPGGLGNAGVMPGFSREDHIHGMDTIPTASGLTNNRAKLELNTPFSIAAGANHRIDYDTVLEDPTGGWDPVLFQWNTSVAGWFLQDVTIIIDTTTAAVIADLFEQVENRHDKVYIPTPLPSGGWTMNFNRIVELSSGDFLSARIGEQAGASGFRIGYSLMYIVCIGTM